MSKKILLDTGPLVALINRQDAHHAWAREQFARARTFLTCEAVVSEACFLLIHRTPGGEKAALSLVASGVVLPEFRLAAEAKAVQKLMAKYADGSMSLADACLVRMAEQHKDAVVFTTDRRDFTVYRKHGDKEIPLLTPQV